MEKKLEHTSEGPSKLAYTLIKRITNDFDHILGSGAFGTVYKGVYEHYGEIAVKVLRDFSGQLDDKEFQKEFNNLRGLQQRNIVKLVGFCNELEEGVAVFEGKQVTTVTLRMALCFEYVRNGSLHRHISDEKKGLNWHTRYKIIKGICDGLKYLREGLQPPVMHFDLKPDNILLDKSMSPKIADFGLSRLFGEQNTRKTMSSVGTCGYWPPEYIKQQVISSEFDIFSLGVIIIKIMTGHEGYNRIADMTARKFVKHVHKNWREQLHKTLGHTSLQIHCNQVKRCIEIALDCLKPNRHERPTIQDIVSSLEETQTKIGDQGRQIEQFYQGDEGFTHPFKSRSIFTITPLSSSSDPMETRSMPWSLIKDITCNFSEDQLVGRGGHGGVYKGVYREVTIAVKKLASQQCDENFSRLVKEFTEATHKNIVQLLGYCLETHAEPTMFEGKWVFVRVLKRCLCFEYLPNGSLAQYISGISSGLDWHTRYRIIKGTCDGLRYLHWNNTVYLDLRPSKILLDKNMMPKIREFGMSRPSVVGSPRMSEVPIRSVKAKIGYMPPEFLNTQVITEKYDMYSLGVTITEIITGSKGYPLSKLVHKDWRTRLEKTVKDTLMVESYCQQVTKCLEIAIKCCDFNPNKRPDMEEVVHMLNQTEKNLTLALIDVQPQELLDVYPLEQCLMCESTEGKKKQQQASTMISCTLQLSNNRGNDHIAFMLVAKNPRRYLTKKPLCGVVPPGSVYTVAITMPKRPSLGSSMEDSFTLRSVAVQQYDLHDVCKGSVPEYKDLFKKAAIDEVHEVMVKTIISDGPAAAQPSAQPAPTFTVQILSTADAQRVLSIDVHPTEPWIMTTNELGSLGVWNYQTMATVDSFQFTCGLVYAAKFIAREKWVITGDGDGAIHVFSYDEDHGGETLDAHDSSIMTLVVHPTHPFVLSSSSDDNGHPIKLWDWSNGWVCMRMFLGHADRVTQLAFNPCQGTDGLIFASASLDGKIKIWSTNSDDENSIMTMDGNSEGLLCLDYFTRHNRQHLITGSKDKTAQIWDLGIKEGCVEELEGHVDSITAVNLHPGLQILITASLDGTVRLWDSTTYKLENIIGLNLGEVYSCRCIKGSTRIVAGCHRGIAIIKIYLPLKIMLAGEANYGEIS